MLARDLIATVVKTFFEALDDVRDGGQRTEGEAPYGKFYMTYFNREREWFLKAPAAEITAFFADDPVYKLEMLTELLYRDARLFTDAEIQGILYRKIIELYEVIDRRSMEFSLERMNRVADLKKFLETN